MENENGDGDWEGSERREGKRRYVIDRRLAEKRKKYWWSLALPTIIGIVGAAIISWGAYVTHTTYGISAKYEQSFDKHVGRQLQLEATNDHRFELMQMDYNSKMAGLREDMNNGFSEMRNSQTDIYNLLINKQRFRIDEPLSNIR